MQQATSMGAAPGERSSWRRQAVVTAAMGMVLVAGFSLQVATGRSSFSAPAIVHIHALVFFGWVVLAVTQATLAATGQLHLHRPLGWLSAGWVMIMLPVGFAVVIERVAAGAVPFFFQPQVFLVLNSATLLCFAGLTAAAIGLRRDTGWHRRLHLCALAVLLGPGFGRLLPMPFLTPYALEIAMLPGLAFPAWLAWREWQESGTLHPAWLPGLAALPILIAMAWTVAHGPAGAALYAAAVEGRAGQQVPGLAFPPFPPG